MSSRRSRPLSIRAGVIQTSWFSSRRERLPPEVVVYDVPPQLVVKIGIPPAGYKYVRAGADILMIAAGTRVVADAIQDQGRI